MECSSAGWRERSGRFWGAGQASQISTREGINMATPAPQEDSLTSLEERIRKTVELVTSLRAERDTAVEESQRLREEIDELRKERKHVRARIEKLLGQMDLLSGT